MKIHNDKKLLSVLSGHHYEVPPLWMMRQAGRYLPEYRALRKKAGSFLDLCYHPDLATEITLQPVERFDFDAAILFSDILVIPHALGQNVRFIEGEGPRLDPIQSLNQLNNLNKDHFLTSLFPIFETVSKVRFKLDPAKTLLGFCGAPWTVASYMIAGKGTPDQAPARLKAYQDPIFLNSLIDLLVEASVDYLEQQIQAGADAVQIFESFGSGLSPALFEDLSIRPIEKIITSLKSRCPDAKIIVFVRGGAAYLEEFSRRSIGDALGIDWMTSLEHIIPKVGLTPLQGNLDPLVLAAGGEALDKAIDYILKVTENRPHIFNLGHGIIPETPLSHVEHMVRRIRGL